jgi:hypothetical protein
MSLIIETRKRKVMNDYSVFDLALHTWKGSQTIYARDSIFRIFT